MVDTVIQAQRRVAREPSEQSEDIGFDFNMRPKWSAGSGPLASDEDTLADADAQPGLAQIKTKLLQGPGDGMEQDASMDLDFSTQTSELKAQVDDRTGIELQELTQEIKGIHITHRLKTWAGGWKNIEAMSMTRDGSQAVGNIWDNSHTRLDLQPAIRVSGFHGEREDLINGFYLLIDGPTHEAPVFRKAGVAGFWCYFACDDTWRVGNTSDMLQRMDPSGDKATIRSSRCKQGLLPDEAPYWECPVGRSDDWERISRRFVVMALTTAAYRSALPEEWTADLWSAAAIQLQRTPCLLVTGANSGWADEVNGRYRAMPGPGDQPPDYQKVESDLWGIFNTRDGTWRFGITEQEKEDSKMSVFRRCNWRHRTRGRAASKVTKPGTLPFEGIDWTLCRDRVCCDACRIWRRAPMDFSVKEVTESEHEAIVGQLVRAESTTASSGSRASRDQASQRLVPTPSQNVGRLGSRSVGVGAQVSARQTEPGDKMGREMGLETGEKAKINLQTYASGFVPTKPVDAYLREECLQIRKFATTIGPYMNEFITAAVEVTGDKVRNHNVLQKYPGLTAENILAIVVFTLELQGFCFSATDDDEFYRLYNFVLRQRKPGNLQLLAGYSHYLFTGLSKLPGYEGVLWRGIRDAEAVKLALDNYKPRLKSIQWSAFSSASPDREVARQFATKDGLIFRLEVFSIARDIRDVSAMPAESERLILPSSTLIVDRLAHKAEDGVWEVHLVEPPAQFTF